jgi:hypothetical protein
MLVDLVVVICSDSGSGWIFWVVDSGVKLVVDGGLVGVWGLDSVGGFVGNSGRDWLVVGFDISLNISN